MTLTPDDLIGYVERDLDADIARWFRAGKPVKIPAGTRSIDHLLDRLPPVGATALAEGLGLLAGMQDSSPE